MWIPALIFTSLLIVFLIAAFFLAPNLTRDQRNILLLLFALLAGFSTFFLGGTALLELKSEVAKGVKVGFSATAGVAVFVFCYLYPPYFFESQPDEKPHLAVPAAGTPAVRSTKPISIAVLDTEDMAFARSIREGFVARVHRELPQAKVDSFAGPAGTGGTPESIQEWRNRARAIMERGRSQPYDYYVSIGTQATIAFKEALGDEFGIIPFIFLGVSDPVDAGVVARLQGRREARNVAGVCYGPGVEEVVAILHDLFPRRKLQYIYQPLPPQDIAMARRLQNTRYYRGGVVSIKETAQFPTLVDMPDPSLVYFGWYTLDLMFERGDGLELLRQRTVVASTEANVERRGLAVAGIAPDDNEIGELGVEILVKHLVEGKTLGMMDVIVPKYHYCINLDTAKDESVELSSDAVPGARRVFKQNQT